jgi:hypothetical protein
MADGSRFQSGLPPPLTPPPAGEGDLTDLPPDPEEAKRDSDILTWL